MTLTPEQIAEGWVHHQGGTPCPLSNERTVFSLLLVDGGMIRGLDGLGNDWDWFKRKGVVAYRIIEAHGTDAAPARPTPFPAEYSELVFDDAGWSQTIIVDGKRPEWLRDDDEYTVGISGMVYKWTRYGGSAFAIRVRRREPKRETVGCHVWSNRFRPISATIDLIDGKPDLSTLKIAEDAL